jgi:hypothetical protein
MLFACILLVWDESGACLQGSAKVTSCREPFKCIAPDSALCVRTPSTCKLLVSKVCVRYLCTKNVVSLFNLLPRARLPRPLCKRVDNSSRTSTERRHDRGFRGLHNILLGRRGCCCCLETFLFMPTPQRRVRGTTQRSFASIQQREESFTITVRRRVSFLVMVT